MNTVKRPVSLTALALLYVAIGAVGLVVHFPGFRGERGFQRDDVWIELTEAVAILSGVFLLQGKNWARWLALAWILFHVVLSAFDAFRGLVIHSVICVVIGWILFRSPTSNYFVRRSER